MARIKRAKVNNDSTSENMNTMDISNTEIKDNEYSNNMDTTSDVVYANTTDKISEINEKIADVLSDKKSKKSSNQSLADFLY